MFARTHRRLSSVMTLALAAAALAAVAPSTQAQSKDDLKVGSQAPAASVAGATLIQGTAPEPFQLGHTYVYEFWATWCAPCRKAIPHMNALYQSLRHKGVHFVGISDEDPNKVRPWVKQRGDGMSYTVIADPDGGFNKAWMKPAKRKGIPSAFIVGPTGRLAFIGHPLDPSFERILRLCADGKYDPVLYKKAEPYLSGIQHAVEGRDWAHAHRQLDKVIEIDPWVFSDQALEKYKLLLIEQEQPEKASAFLDMQIKVYGDKPDVLADIARMLVDDPDLPSRDQAAAARAITALALVQGEKDPVVLEVLALVAFRKGDVNSAVRNQFQAWMAADPDMKPAYKLVLDKYKKEQAGSGKGDRRSGRR